MPPSSQPDFVAEEVVGYRAWDVEPPTILRPVRLFSIMHDFEWSRDGWTEAECDHCGSEIPGEHCSCGIYAARTALHLWDMSYSGRVVGEVGLAGKVIVGTKGYRAAKGRPRRLYVSYGDWKIVRPLRECFGVPVQLINTEVRP